MPKVSPKGSTAKELSRFVAGLSQKLTARSMKGDSTDWLTFKQLEVLHQVVGIVYLSLGGKDLPSGHRIGNTYRQVQKRYRNVRLGELVRGIHRRLMEHEQSPAFRLLQYFKQNPKMRGSEKLILSSILNSLLDQKMMGFKFHSWNEAWSALSRLASREYETETQQGSGEEEHDYKVILRRFIKPLAWGAYVDLFLMQQGWMDTHFARLAPSVCLVCQYQEQQQVEELSRRFPEYVHHGPDFLDPERFKKLVERIMAAQRQRRRRRGDITLPLVLAGKFTDEKSADFSRVLRAVSGPWESSNEAENRIAE
jgi:hypothetical protein